MYSDKNLTCADCGQEFVFTASEQDFYAQRGFTEPRRCAILSSQPQGCAQRRGRRQQSYGGYGAGGGYSAGGGYGGGGGGGGGSYGSRDRGPREMFTATCSNCGREAQVPFRPTSGKPVYCSDCFRSHARRLIPSSRRGPTHGPPNQRDPRPGLSADRGRSILRARAPARSPRNGFVTNASWSDTAGCAACRLSARPRGSRRNPFRSRTTRPRARRSERRASAVTLTASRRASRGRTCAPCRAAAGRCCRRGPAR